MSSPPTYEQSQSQNQSKAGDVAATPTSPVPPTPPPSAGSIAQHIGSAFPDITQSTESLHSQQPSVGNESEYQCQGEGNLSRCLENKPCFIWAVAVEDIVLATCTGTITMVFEKSKEKVHIDPVLGRKPTWADVYFMVVIFRCIVQFSIGLGLLFGLLSTKKSRTLFSLRAWMLGAIFIFFQQLLSFAINIIKFYARYEDAATAWRKVAIVVGDILLHVFTSLLVGKFWVNFKNENLHDSQEQRPEAHELNSI